MICVWSDRIKLLPNKLVMGWNQSQKWYRYKCSTKWRQLINIRNSFSHNRYGLILSSRTASSLFKLWIVFHFMVLCWQDFSNTIIMLSFSIRLKKSPSRIIDLDGRYRKTLFCRGCQLNCMIVLCFPFHQVKTGINLSQFYMYIPVVDTSASFQGIHNILTMISCIELIENWQYSFNCNYELHVSRIVIPTSNIGANSMKAY